MTLSDKIKEAYAALEYNYDRMRNYEDGRRIMAKALKDSAEVIARVERYEAALKMVSGRCTPEAQLVIEQALSQEDTCKS